MSFTFSTAINTVLHNILMLKNRLLLSGWKDNMVKQLIEWSGSVVSELHST